MSEAINTEASIRQRNTVSSIEAKAGGPSLNHCTFDWTERTSIHNFEVEIS